ncbi:MAG: metallopeptidase family protein [Tissierellia bacterium]|nr:metallopeptidase family protein [Tissierellia bacterium]
MIHPDRLDEVEEILNDIYDEIPAKYLKGLNGGILISEEIKYHPKAKRKDLIVLGQYERSILGRSITIFYGSFMEMFGFLTHEELREKLKETLFHELTHHLEFLANEKDLELEDLRQLQEYKKRGHYE